MSATQQRDRAGQLASSNSALALSTARAIHDSWFACQALAWVARFAPEQEFPKIVYESLHVVRAETDPYRAVAPSAWPLRAIVERDRLEILPFNNSRTPGSCRKNRTFGKSIRSRFSAFSGRVSRRLQTLVSSSRITSESIDAADQLEAKTKSGRCNNDCAR